jgi:uncharacterized protein
LTTEDLRSLLALQDIDTAIDRDRHRRANLPERAEVTAVDQKINEMRAEANEAVAARDAVARRQGAIEEELATTEERAAAVNRRLYSGEVTASRELQAMAADADTLKARASHLEDEVLEILDEREPFDRRVADLAASITDLAGRREEASRVLAVAESEVDRELAELAARREEAVAAVPPALLATYERLRPRLDGVAVARLVGDHCDGCHLSLSATELDRIRHLPPGEVATCEQCGRILVRPAP